MPKISALTSLAQADVVTTTDVLPIVDATAPATTKKVTVQAMVNAGLATLTTLPSGIVNASLNSITPSGGTLTTNGVFRTTGSVGIGGNELYTAAGRTTLNVNGTSSALIGVTLNDNVSSAAYLFWDGTNAILSTTGAWRFQVGAVTKATLDASSFAVTGSISATGSIGVSNIGGTAEYPIDVIRADASAVSLRIRNDSASANAYSMVGVNASGNAWGMRMGSAAANSNALEWVLDAFSSPVVKMSLTTAGNLSVTGAINATGTIASSNALETLNSGSLYQYNAGSTTFFRSRNDGNNLDVSYNGGGVITRTNTSGFAVTGLTTTDTLRVNVTPTAETPTATHTAVFNINGTNYKFLCLAA